MDPEQLQLRLTVRFDVEPGSPGRRNASDLTEDLYEELRAVDLRTPRYAFDETVVELGLVLQFPDGIVIELAATGGKLQLLVRAMQDWLSRHRPEVVVVLAANGQVVELRRDYRVPAQRIVAALAPVVSEFPATGESDDAPHAEQSDEPTRHVDIAGVDADFGWDDGERG